MFGVTLDRSYSPYGWTGEVTEYQRWKQTQEHQWQHAHHVRQELDASPPTHSRVESEKPDRMQAKVKHTKQYYFKKKISYFNQKKRIHWPEPKLQTQKENRIAEISKWWKHPLSWKWQKNTKEYELRMGPQQHGWRGQNHARWHSKRRPGASWMRRLHRFPVRSSFSLPQLEIMNSHSVWIITMKIMRLQRVYINNEKLQLYMQSVRILIWAKDVAE